MHSKAFVMDLWEGAMKCNTTHSTDPGRYCRIRNAFKKSPCVVGSHLGIHPDPNPDPKPKPSPWCLLPHLIMAGIFMCIVHTCINSEVHQSSLMWSHSHCAQSGNGHCTMHISKSTAHWKVSNVHLDSIVYITCTLLQPLNTALEKVHLDSIMYSAHICSVTLLLLLLLSM